MNDKRNQFEYAEKDLNLQMQKALQEIAKEESKPKEIFSEIAELLSVEALKVCSNKIKIDLTEDVESTDPHGALIGITVKIKGGGEIGHEPYEKFANMINNAVKQGLVIGSIENLPPVRLRLSSLLDATENKYDRYILMFHCVSTIPQSILEKAILTNGNQ
jgi:hypothetical protein